MAGRRLRRISAGACLPATVSKCAALVCSVWAKIMLNVVHVVPVFNGVRWPHFSSRARNYCNVYPSCRQLSRISLSARHPCSPQASIALNRESIMVNFRLIARKYYSHRDRYIIWGLTLPA